MEKPNELLAEYYLEDNYKIINFNNVKNICYIFFSSNGLYKDRNDTTIIKKMRDADRYEWKDIASNKKIVKKAKKIIFLRDIFKIFYIRGINNCINSINKIRDLLIEETRGMVVITAGSSAGAYMALLLGNMLPNTHRIIALGGVVDLEYFRTFSSYLDDNLDKCDYVNISNHLFGDYWIINFYGEDNGYDKQSANLLDNFANRSKLINIGFKSNEHAPRPTGEDLVKLLVCSEKHLQKLMNKVGRKKIVDKRFFSHINLGSTLFFYMNFKRFLIRVIRK